MVITVLFYNTLSKKDYQNTIYKYARNSNSVRI